MLLPFFVARHAGRYQHEFIGLTLADELGKTMVALRRSFDGDGPGDGLAGRPPGLAHCAP